MKAKKRKPSPPAAPAAPPPRPSRWPVYALGALAGLIAVLWAYSPALRGVFVFDDNFLRFAMPDQAAQPLSAWLAGDRPLLMVSYWINSRLSGVDPYSYHVVNVLIHCVSAALVFLIARRLLAEARSAAVLAGFAAALFLLHPLQTEAVAYLSGRSDELSAMFSLAAFAVFLYRRRPSITWFTAAAVLALFALALLSKQQAIVLPVLLLLADYWFNPGFSFCGIRANWRLYAPMAACALGGAAFFWKTLTTATTAGFGFKDFTWYQYFFTQCRALFVYLREFLLPVNLNADWDFPLSKTILDHGAIIGLVALLAISAAAWIYRRRFPLAGFGWFAFLAMMTPTSSFLPIQDVVAERRVYFAMLALLLILVDLLARLPIDRKGLAAACVLVCLVAAAATHARAAVWAGPVEFWEDAVRKSPNKFRTHFYLGFMYYAQGRYQEAITEFEKTAAAGAPTYDLLVDWGMAYDNLGQPEQALAKLRAAAAVKPSALVYVNIATVYAKGRNWQPALAALDTAQQADPNFPDTYINRGKIFLANGQADTAIPQLQRALQLDPSSEDARRYLAMALGQQSPR